MELSLTVLTLNCWGIAGISKDRKRRMEAIGSELSSGKYDFVFLQEVWVEEDFQLIVQKCHQVLPFSHYFLSGVIGSGVCILSRAKIRNVFFHTWPINGYIVTNYQHLLIILKLTVWLIIKHKIHHGDWFGGKGVGMCTVSHRGYTINLYVTHVSCRL